VPADVAVVAFDQTDAYKLFPVPVTFIKQPLPAIASATMELLLERMDDIAAPIKVRELEARLKIKASSM
ncbi:MAG: substrate-binding domain-containing protein, partial [Flavobacterium sp.]